VTLRARLLLIFGGIVVITIALVSYAVSAGARKSFQQIYEQRTASATKQVGRELEMQGQALATQTAAIAGSEPVRSMALALSGSTADPAPYVNLAASLASQQQLDYVDLLTQDGMIISSAHWPARFGVREAWINELSDWNNQTPFLKYEETPRGKELALVCVRQVSMGDRNFDVVAGRRIDSNFLSSLVLPEGTQVLLWVPTGDAASEFQDVHGPRRLPADLKPVLEQTLSRKSEITHPIHLDDTPDGTLMAQTMPLLDRSAAQVFLRSRTKSLG
jgi:two-component system nitrogen regulation sensor histidine kinase NtrY